MELQQIPIYNEAVLPAFLKLVRRLDGGSMSANHFIAIASRVARNPADGMMVFGLGKDAEFWRALNHGSRLTIIEDDPTWIERALIPGIELIQVDYTSRVGKPSALGELSEGLLGRSNEWGTVLVDGPRGSNTSHPGREQSIYMASEIRRRSGASVFIHDYERRWENECAARFLGHPDEIIPSPGERRLLAYWRQGSDSYSGPA